ncbi:hypothetical protein COB55_00280 [Candidatus Wolfebacteria bacterium]|nr:MAG: hypothetical protein COB55_00280 [Candidatus Wolfebacteria bacterium]
MTVEFLRKKNLKAISMWDNSYITLEELTGYCADSEILRELLDSVVVCSLRYLESVCEFTLVNMKSSDEVKEGEFEEADENRRRVHEANMDAINILARNMKKHGCDGTWVTKCSSVGRTAYGKFALMIAFEKMSSK